MSLFEDRWKTLARSLRIPSAHARDIGLRLRNAYQDPSRHHHGVGHIEAMLERISLMKSSFNNHRQAELAAFFHDAVLTPGADDNEDRSMFLMMQAMTQSALAPAHFAHPSQMILATKTHQRTKDDELDLFIDIDKEMLGAPWPTYLGYAQGIWREYGPRLGEAAYRDARARKFLKPTLAAGNVFLTPHFAHLNGHARHNMLNELVLLEGPAPLDEALSPERL